MFCEPSFGIGARGIGSNALGYVPTSARSLASFTNRNELVPQSAYDVFVEKIESSENVFGETPK